MIMLRSQDTRVAFALMCLRRWVLVFLLAFSGAVADPTVKTHVAQLKGQRLVMKANIELFGTPTFAFDRRQIWEAPVYFKDMKPSIAGNTNWVATHFASEKTYRVKDAKYQERTKTLQIKMWEVNSKTDLEPEIKLNFPNIESLTPSRFDELFYAIFLRPNESLEDYLMQNRLKLIEKYIDQFPELVPLPVEAKHDLLLVIQVASSAGKPQLTRINEGLYIPCSSLNLDQVRAYNDLTVTKNQRIASSIEANVVDFSRVALVLNVRKVPDAILGFGSNGPSATETS